MSLKRTFDVHLINILHMYSLHYFYHLKIHSPIIMVSNVPFFLLHLLQLVYLLSSLTNLLNEPNKKL
jgi:hypothetical protein